MGMRHPDRPCMNRAVVPVGYGPDTRSPDEKARDPYDTQNPVSLEAGACLMPCDSTEQTPVELMNKQGRLDAKRIDNMKHKIEQQLNSAAKAARREACIADRGTFYNAGEMGFSEGEQCCNHNWAAIRERRGTPRYDALVAPRRNPCKTHD